ncbi:hypothetical protein N7481_007173 [Penicillium waksmanii]|uniref:uncharacterized protein n=1 Tax=Penicillium waksmanii TaxID=69791 RepID=UPI0025486046|nr:uncharacterized protein N7481_007173 [Penicillium waksmanii]KAJ5979875.1 hypothetical protein N7481_007173 [Penicillium waksmanii]
MSFQAPYKPPEYYRQSQTPVSIQGEQRPATHTQPTSLATPLPQDSYNNYYRNEINSNRTNNEATAIFAPVLSEVLSEDPMQQIEYRGTGARIEDNEFQDLDLAFLDNSMRGT